MPISVLEDQVQKNTIVTGDAVLNFANRVSEAVKRYFIQTTDAWKIEQKATLEQVASEVAAPVKIKINAMAEKVQALQHILQIEQFEAFNKKVMTQVSNELRAESKIHLEKWTRDHEQALRDIRPFDESMLKPKEQLQEQQAQQATERVGAGLSADVVIQKALKTAQVVSDVQGFKEVASFLTKKVERLQKSDFTIALFGAFSAGKSSFSNALMGDRVLPVSPNPTTAAINKIRPVTDEHPHETADVHLKTEAQLLEDIQGSYAAIGLTVSSLKEAFDRAQEGLAVKLTDERLNVHKSFIRAYAEGYESFIPKLGTTIRVNRPD